MASPTSSWPRSGRNWSGCAPRWRHCRPLGPPTVRARRSVRWASVGSAVLLVLGLVLVPLSVLAIWTNNQVSDTERFVATVSPIVEDPSVQTALADRITAEVLARVDIRQIVDETVNALAAQGLPPPVVDRCGT